MFSPFYPIFGLFIPISLTAPLASMLSQSILRGLNRIHFAHATLWLPGAYLGLAIYNFRVLLVLAPLSCPHFSHLTPSYKPITAAPHVARRMPPRGIYPSFGLIAQGTDFGVNSFPLPIFSGLSITTQSLQSLFPSGPSLSNQITQMVAQQPSQAQLQPNHFSTTSPLGSLPSQQTSFPPQGQLPQIQQPSFFQPGAFFFFHFHYPLTKIYFHSSMSWILHLQDMRCCTCVQESVLISDTGWQFMVLRGFAGTHNMRGG